VNCQFHALAGLPTVPIAQEVGWAPVMAKRRSPCPCRNRMPVVHPGLVPNILPALKCEILPLSSNYDGVAKPQPCYHKARRPRRKTAWILTNTT